MVVPAIASALVVAALTATPQVKLVTLDGEERQGELRALSASSVALTGVEGTDSGKLEAPLDDVLQLEFLGEKQPEQPTGTVFVELVDGSRLTCKQATVGARDAKLHTSALGKLSVPLSSVASIRFGKAGTAHAQAWQELRQEKLERDLLVIRKGDVLDHLAGVIDSIDEKVVVFLFDGTKLPVGRDKVFGLVYSGRTLSKAKPVCEAVLAEEDRLLLRSVAWEEDGLRGELLAGTKIALPVAAIRTLDFSLGKVRYLSQLEPRDVRYTPFFDVKWEYRRDSNLDGGPLKVGDQTYRRGLCIHSKTRLRYRLGGEYRRLKAVMGIDRSVNQGDVHVVVSGVLVGGEQRMLLETDVRSGDEPQPLDLDVTDIRDLEILVDFGGNLDIADHLVLADARVVK